MKRGGVAILFVLFTLGVLGTAYLHMRGREPASPPAVPHNPSSADIPAFPAPEDSPKVAFDGPPAQLQPRPDARPTGAGQAAGSGVQTPAGQGAGQAGTGAAGGGGTGLSASAGSGRSGSGLSGSLGSGQTGGGGAGGTASPPSQAAPASTVTAERQAARERAEAEAHLRARKAEEATLREVARMRDRLETEDRQRMASTSDADRQGEAARVRQRVEREAEYAREQMQRLERERSSAAASKRAEAAGERVAAAPAPPAPAQSPSPSAKELAEEEACRARMRRLGVISSGKCEDIGEIVKNLAEGVYTFNKPAEGYVDEPLKLVLVLKTADDQDVSKSFTNTPGTRTEREGRFAQSLEAVVRGDDFKVEPSGPQARTATFLEPVEWNWTVIPQAGGNKILTIEVIAYIQVGVDRHRVPIRTLRETISIRVSWWQQVKPYVTDWGRVIAAVTGAASGTIAIATAIPKTRKRLQSLLLWLAQKLGRKRPLNRAERRAAKAGQ